MREMGRSGRSDGETVESVLMCGEGGTSGFMERSVSEQQTRWLLENSQNDLSVSCSAAGSSQG